MSEFSANTEKGKRLNKLSPLFILIHVLMKSIIPLIGFYTYGRTQYADTTFMIVAAVAIVLFAVLQYWFYHYWLQDDKIEIKEGILFKKNRKVPYTRIQNVNVSQGLLQRFFKVATLQLESASGGKPEAVMRVVGLNVVEEIKGKVKAASNQNNDTLGIEEENKDEQQPLHEVSITEVIKYGVISQKGMFYGAILFGFLAQNQTFFAGLTKYLYTFYETPDFSQITLAQGFIYALVVGIIIFVFLQLMSILWSLVKFYQFKIEKHDDRLQASMGLISKISATIPMKRIQLFRISENPLHKFYKSQTISIETAGGVNTDKSGIVMRWLAPIIQKSKVKDFMLNIEPKISMGSIGWQLIPQRAWKRVLKKALFFVLLFAAIIYVNSSALLFEVRFYLWMLPVLMLPLSYWYAKTYVLKTAYFINNDIICFKSGVWFGKQSYVKINKVQTVEVLESPFDRRNKMATLEVDTAGSNTYLHHIKIPYLEVADAYKIRNLIQEKLKETKFDW